MPDSEKELVVACQQASGEDFEEAYSKIYALFKDRVYTICLRVTTNRDDALDAAQETMVTLARRIGDFAWRSRFSSWVYRIAVNSAIDVRRRRLDSVRAGVKTSVGGVETEKMQEATPAGESTDPVRNAARSESQQAVRDALEHINPKFSSLLVLRYTQNLSYEEIAETLDCELGTVKSRLNRAHGALRDYLAQRGGSTLHLN